ncbi:MAG: hypothetical protein HY319_01910 [Armatimonadetes bacterium]|nr:hypothetical protein [Armatimonadota bacterium]
MPELFEVNRLFVQYLFLVAVLLGPPYVLTRLALDTWSRGHRAVATGFIMLSAVVEFRVVGHFL